MFDLPGKFGQLITEPKTPAVSSLLHMLVALDITMIHIAHTLLYSTCLLLYRHNFGQGPVVYGIIKQRVIELK